MGAISVDNLTVSFGNKLGLDGVTFDVQKGSVIALLGPNGAGKTTVINSLIGQVKPLSGTVRVLGYNPIKDRRKLSSKWAIMPQNGGLPTGLNVRETIELFSELYGRQTNVNHLLEVVGLSGMAKQKWRKLSGGEQQKLSLAIALCGGQDLILLDEPTAGLDITSKIELLSAIRERADKGSTVVITTHIYGDAENIADQVIVLNKGQLIANASIDQLKTKKQEITFKTKPGLPIETLAKDLQKQGSEVSPGRYVLRGSADSKTLTLLTSWLGSHGAEVQNLKVGSKSLKEVVYDLTESAQELSKQAEGV